ncbi:Tyrosyl-DNA phosphodiesterase 2 [Oopsacas minuta]|uniref:Tyrosyl-DNA phosphodiesterase 2 n=1 Tax=Oopsacas minuta TaxID=111878 RepID=A0AAV7K648_9METZ|nr:Tyrosyl-DNA phosphodiesterase 2 [Oopsacas minuta]
MACSIQDTNIEVEQSVTSKSSSDDSQLQNFTLLSWNIDGLDGKDLQERSLAVIQLINTHKPDIVFLQEVVPQSHLLIAKRCIAYKCIFCRYTSTYYNAILLLKDRVKVAGEHGTIPFQGSIMGRHYIFCDVSICSNQPIRVITTHLESTKDIGPTLIRRDQLGLMSNLISKLNIPCIFGGDLNLRDEDVKEAGLSPAIQDVWEYMGSEKEHEYTWDTSVNNNLGVHFKAKLRFDRLLFSHPDGLAVGMQVLPMKFELVGKEKLPCGRFPSDHWGICAGFMLIF